MESDVVTIIPVRSHPPPARRLITRKTTIRPYVFRKHKSEATKEKQEKSLTKKSKHHKSPLRTNNSLDIKYQNNIGIASNSSNSKSDLNISKKNESSTKSSTKKRNTSKCNVSQLSENIENISNVKTRSAPCKLSESLSTVKPSDFKPCARDVSNLKAQSKNASLMSLSSKSKGAFSEHLRNSSHKIDDRISPSFLLAENTAVPLSESESCSYSTDAILICRPANEGNSECNVASQHSASIQTCTKPSPFYEQSAHIVPLSSEKIIQTKSILKAPIKKDNEVHELAYRETFSDIPTPTSKRKHSNPVNLSYQFKKLKNSDKNRSTLQKIEKGNNKKKSSQKKNATKDWMDQFTVIEGNNVLMNSLESHSMEIPYLRNMSNSINENSLNCSAWKDGEVLPVLESTRYSLIPQNKQLIKDLNSPEAHSSTEIQIGKKAGNISKSVRWNTSVSYQIVSPSPKRKRKLRRNLGKVKAVNRQKTASVLKEQKEIQSEEHPPTSTSVNLELSKENSSQLHSNKKPKASQTRLQDTEKMIVRKNPRKKKNIAESDVDVCFNAVLQKTEKFREETENEDIPRIAGIFRTLLTEKIIIGTEDSEDSVPSKKNGKSDIEAKKLQLEVLHKHHDLKRLKEKFADQEIKQQKLKESAHRREEISLFLYKLQDFHQRIMN